MENGEKKWAAMLKDFAISPPESCRDARERVKQMCIDPKCQKVSLICSEEEAQAHITCEHVDVQGVTHLVQKRMERQKDFIRSTQEIDEQFMRQLGQIRQLLAEKFSFGGLEERNVEIIRMIYANGERESLRGKEADEFWRRLKRYGSEAKEGLFRSLLDTYQGSFRRFLGEIEELKEKIFLAFSEGKEFSAISPAQALKDKDRQIEDYQRQLEELRYKSKEESQEIAKYRQKISQEIEKLRQQVARRGQQNEDFDLQVDSIRQQSEEFQLDIEELGGKIAANQRAIREKEKIIANKNQGIKDRDQKIDKRGKEIGDTNKRHREERDKKSRKGSSAQGRKKHEELNINIKKHWLDDVNSELSALERPGAVTHLSIAFEYYYRFDKNYVKELAQILRGMTSLSEFSLSMPYGLFNNECFMNLAESLNSLPYLHSLEVSTKKGQTIQKDNWTKSLREDIRVERTQQL